MATKRRARGKQASAGERAPAQLTEAEARLPIDDASKRRFNARPDPIDFRDIMYEATLVEVPTGIPLAAYRKVGVPILDQGAEGACTGYGLATVANYLLRRRRVVPDRTSVSARMLYELARRYDEWEGEDYEGSSARGAIKAWHKHGVCPAASWRDAGDGASGGLTNDLAVEAAKRPLGAYYRVNHKNLTNLHAALTEVGVLYATSVVHDGWRAPSKSGRIPYAKDAPPIGGHAFAIVAYDEQGFWIQNSWGGGWGFEGFGHVSYDDWLQNATDVWVARLGAPVVLRSTESAAVTSAATSRTQLGSSTADLRPHIISVGNDGLPRRSGTFGTSDEDIRHILRTDVPRVTKAWKKKRLLVYAHGGLVDEASAIQRVAEYRETLLDAEVYPIAFIWKTDYFSTLKNILEDATRQRKPAGILDAAKDFLLDRIDDALEPLARVGTGKAEWDEMKENALGASTEPDGAARLVAEELAALVRSDAAYEIHVIGHSAGAIFLAPFTQRLATNGPIAAGPLSGDNGLATAIKTLTLWAPACTTKLFHDTYRPVIADGAVGRPCVFTLTDRAEQDDDCASIYHKSLLYLVSDAFEQRVRIPLLRPDGEPILGMEKFLSGPLVSNDPELEALVRSGRLEWVRAPNTEPTGSPNASASHSHGGFDDDGPTVSAALARILGGGGGGVVETTHADFGTDADLRRSAISRSE